MVAAARVLAKHDVDPTERIPVFDLAEREGVVVQFKALPHLAGAYVREDGLPPGMIINNKLPLSKQRYTVGHELGHHVFEHVSSLDLDTDLLDPGQSSSAMPDHEKVAEAFAAWLLMPRRQIQCSMNLLGIDKPKDPVGVYQLALIAGTSYRAMCVHLRSLKLLDQTQVETLLKTQPKVIKQQLLAGSGLSTSAADVIVLGPRDAGRDVHVGTGDVLIVHGSAGEAAPLLEPLPEFVTARAGCPTAGEAQIVVVKALAVENPLRAFRSAPLTVTSCDQAWSLNLVAQHPVSGVSESWFA